MEMSYIDFLRMFLLSTRSAVLHALSMILLALSFAGCSEAEISTNLPLGAPKDELHEDILALAPIGSSVSDVTAIIEKSFKHEGRGDLVYNKSGGAVRLDDWWEHRGSPMTDWMIGSRSIEIKIGSYRSIRSMFIFETQVYAGWGFNSACRLVGVYIHKEIDNF